MYISLSSLGASLFSIVNAWIYSVTCRYMFFNVILVYFCHKRWTGIFAILGLIVACVYCLKLWNLSLLYYVALVLGTGELRGQVPVTARAHPKIFRGRVCWGWLYIYVQNSILTFAVVSS